MNTTLNISKLSMTAFFCLWFIFITNIGVISNVLVITFSILFVLFLFLNFFRPILLTNLIQLPPSSILILVCFLILITQYFLLELLFGDLSAHQSSILRGYLGISFIFVTIANFKNTLHPAQKLKTFIFYSTLVIFTSVALQFLNPEYWNQIADTSDRVVSDEGQTGRAFGLMFNALDLVFICGIFLVGIVITEEKIGSSFITSLTKFLLIIMLLLCFARSAYIILFLLFCLNPLKNMKYIWLVIPVAYLLYLNDFLYGDGFERISYLFGSVSEFTTGGSSKNRSEIIATIIGNAGKVPFFGLGLDGRDTVLPSYWRAHNFVLESFMTVGVFGLILISIIWIAIAKILFFSGLKIRSQIVIFLVPLVSLMTVGHVTWSFTLYFYFFLILALDNNKKLSVL
jgi:hypothetical protein